MRDRQVEKSIVLPLLNLYKDNIKEIDSLFRTHIAKDYELQVGDHNLDSIDELETIDLDEPIHELRFVNYGAIVLSLTVNPRTSEITYREDSVKVFGIAKKLEEVLLKARKSPAIDIFYKMFCTIFIGIPVFMVLNLFFNMFLGIRFIGLDSLPILYMMLISIFLFFIVIYMRNYVMVNKISVESKKLKVHFFKRNKEKIFLVFLGSLFTTLLGVIVYLVLEYFK